MDNFDEMQVDEAIKFLDEYSEQVECDKCHVVSKDCANHGCPLVRSVSAIKKGTFVNVTEEELEDIKADICDNYCKKLAEYNEKSNGLEAVYNFDEFLDEVCSKCPLSRL